MMTNDKRSNTGPEKSSSSNSGSKIKGSSKLDIEAEVARRVAKNEKERLEKAKKLAADIQRRAILTAATANKDGGPSSSSGTLGNEIPALLRNMCGILNKGFASLGADMKDLKSSVNGQFNSLSEALEVNDDFWGGYDDNEMEDGPSVDGEEREPGPPEPFRLCLDHEMSEEETSDQENGSVGAFAGFNLANSSHDASADSENLFARFARTLRVPTDVGADLDPHLANLLNQVFERPLAPEEFLRIKEATLRPANCVQLQVPPVPEAIWVKISSELKGRDKSMQKLHGDFLCFILKIIRCLEKLHELLPSCPAIGTPVEELAEALGVAGHIHKVGFIEQRRETLKPDLPGEFKRLAGSNFPPCPSSLFGDNLVENVKSISEVARLSERMAAAGKTKTSQLHQRGRFHPYTRGRFNNFRRGRAGRGRGRGWRGFNPNQAGPSS